MGDSVVAVREPPTPSAYIDNEPVANPSSPTGTAQRQRVAVDATKTTVASALSVVTVGAAFSTVLAANATRRSMVLQNVGILPVYLGFGLTPTTTSYHVVLAGGSVLHDGHGGLLTDSQFTGLVCAICTGPTGLLAVTEF